MAGLNVRWGSRLIRSRRWLPNQPDTRAVQPRSLRESQYPVASWCFRPGWLQCRS